MIFNIFFGHKIDHILCNNDAIIKNSTCFENYRHLAFQWGVKQVCSFKIDETAEENVPKSRFQ